MCSPRSSSGTPTARPPVSAFLGSSTNMVSLAASGAGSLASMALPIPVLVCTRMKAPPPIPEANGFFTPRHSAVATAASAAWPPALSASAPTSEQSPWSDATTPYFERTSLGLPT